MGPGLLTKRDYVYMSPPVLEALTIEGCVFERNGYTGIAADPLASA